MFFKKKSIILSNIMSGITDSHSHILPGVDDGVRTLSEACNILSYFETLGVRQVILTPHIMEDYPLNTVDFLTDKFRSLCNVYKGSIKLVLAGEYMLDSSFEKKLEKNSLLPLFNNHLLVETSYMQPPVYFEELIKKIQSQGYYVILAHPERYIYMGYDDYKLLKVSNVKFQLNILSLAGVYGTQVQEKSNKLLAKDMYDCIGSDIHNYLSFRKEIEQMKLSTSVLKELELLKRK